MSAVFRQIPHIVYSTFPVYKIDSILFFGMKLSWQPLRFVLLFTHSCFYFHRSLWRSFYDLFLCRFTHFFTRRILTFAMKFYLLNGWFYCLCERKAPFSRTNLKKGHFSITFLTIFTQIILLIWVCSKKTNDQLLRSIWHCKTRRNFRPR